MDDNLKQIVKLAHDIDAGLVNNFATKQEWYGAIQKLADEVRQPNETSQMAFARVVTQESDGKAMFKAYKSAGGSDYQPEAVPEPVLKAGTAYSRLRDIAAGIAAADPKLTRHQAFAKAFDAHPDLAVRAKREQAFT
jgi:hypothetical protein